jgi:hypothetical protein
LRRVQAVVDGFAVRSQPDVEQLPARVVMAAVIERRRSPELLADQLPLRVVLNAGRVSVRRTVAEVAGEDNSPYASKRSSNAIR